VRLIVWGVRLIVWGVRTGILLVLTIFTKKKATVLIVAF
jgi:hypothetical protein